MSQSILCKDDHRISLFPIPNENIPIWELYKKHESTDWNAGEVNFVKDQPFLKKLSDPEKLLIKRVITFFAKGDDLINLNIEENLLPMIRMRECKMFYDYKKRIENVHIEVYSRFVESYMPTPKEQQEIFNDITQNVAVSNKFKWIQDYIISNNTDNKTGNNTGNNMGNIPTESKFALLILMDFITEGLFFSGSFAIIFWFQSRNMLPALCEANELIRRDETIHVDGADLFYNKYIPQNEKLDVKIVHNIMSKAVNTEVQFMNSAMPNGAELPGMNINLMTQYIKYMADYLLDLIKYTKLFNVKNPFPFMDKQGLQTKTNFFEHNASQYTKAKTQMTNEEKQLSFSSKKRRK